MKEGTIEITESVAAVPNKSQYKTELFQVTIGETYEVYVVARTKTGAEGMSETVSKVLSLGKFTP